MLRCIFCGDCEDACPKEAIFLTDRKVDSLYKRKNLVYGKDILVEPKDNPIDLSKRQTPDVKEFKQHKEYAHNVTSDKKR
jgi:NADH-quinone oxidoreductase subunit I